MIMNPALKIHKGVAYLSDEAPFRDKEDLYLRVRSAEGRLLSDAQVRSLPHLSHVETDRRLAAEWAIRAVSVKRFVRHVQKLPSPRTLLDVGCGNGWMSHLLATTLATMPGTEVIGLDLNRHELEQAVRVFGQQPNLRFVYGNILDPILQPETLDVIVGASALHYFPDIHHVMAQLLRLLKPAGELHIFDSPVFTSSTIAAARHRTAEYYARLGVPDMTAEYHHLCMDELDQYQPHVAYRPRRGFGRIARLLGRPYVPFPWLMIKNLLSSP